MQDNLFRKVLRTTKDLTHSQFEKLAKQYGLTLQQAQDELNIVNGYVGRKQW